MKTAKRLYRIGFPVSALASAIAPRPSRGSTDTDPNGHVKAESLVLAAEDSRAKALVEVDMEALRDMTDVNYTHVESNGRFRTRDEFLRGLEVGEYRFKTFVIDSIRIRVEGNVAVVTGNYHNDIVTSDGLQPTKYARFIRVWARRDGRWVNVAHQATTYSRVSKL